MDDNPIKGVENPYVLLPEGTYKYYETNSLTAHYGSYRSVSLNDDIALRLDSITVEPIK